MLTIYRTPDDDVTSFINESVVSICYQIRVEQNRNVWNETSFIFYVYEYVIMFIF